ncbi:hypothetical protein BKA70DRAFT_666148 [Coprinopsis sp. MPI-PUGE-AT-0042]|nr:hypothetical protein BKA70DRAFT_666148 [Coprinopsis sp. MPI-PUGE-AT-0042]
MHAQQPTCTNVRIRSTQDTHKIFYAVQKGILKMVTRRLDADERLALRSGCVYAWEERGPHSEITGLGIERFTEGRRWTPSRVRDEFLFYYERYMPPLNVDPTSPASEKPPRDWEPMVKQTYSVWVETDNGRRKWHLTAYFTQGTIDQLGTVDDIPGIGELVVPDGLFKSTRVSKSRSKNEDRGESGSKSSTVTRTYAAFPSPYPSRPPNTDSSAINTQPVLMYEPYQKGAHSGYYHAQSDTTESGSRSRESSQSQSPKERSPVALSPTVPSHQPQFSSDPVVLHPPPTAVPSYTPVPSASGHDLRSHPSEYLASYPASQSVMGGINDHGQRDNYSINSAWNVNHPSTHMYQQLHPASPNGNLHQSMAYGYTGMTQNDHSMASMSYSAYQPTPMPTSPTHYDTSTYELVTGNHHGLMNSGEFGVVEGERALAPLVELTRSQPYKRDRQDDRTLRMLQNAAT